MSLVRGDGAQALRWPSAARSRTTRALLVAAVALGTTACSDAGEPGAAGAPPAAATGAPLGAPTATPSSSATPGPTPTPGPSDIPKISRPGQTGKPRITAAPVPFTSPVSYADGVALTVDAVERGVETGQGPGVFAGREFATFTVTLRNGTKGALDIQQVVVTSTYGARGLVAERVYASDTRAVDFGGTLAPGASATARYAFAVPAAHLGDVRLVVDFDGIHTSAEFTGDARKVS